jgi:hypothetical protein
MYGYESYINRLIDQKLEWEEQAQLDQELEWLGEDQPIEFDPILHPDQFDENGKLVPIPDEW